MQTVSNLYESIISPENHWFETKVVINGVTYDKTVLVEVSTSLAMFSGTPEIGKAVSQEITVRMLTPDETIPPMANLKPYVRACNKTQQSEWLQQGNFYIDTRETTKNEHGVNVMTIHGYDAMLKAEQMYNGRFTGNNGTYADSG